MLPRSKKVFSSVIAACIAVSMSPITNNVAYADNLQAASIATQSNTNEFKPYWDLNEDELKGVSFDPKTNTLTFKNVDISSGSYHSIFELNKANKSDYTLTINIVGTNKISANKGSVIKLNDSGCKVNVVVKGNGTLRTDNVNFICTRSGSVDIKSSTLDLRNVPYDTGAITAKKGTVTVNKNAKISITTKKFDSEFELSYAINAKKMTNSYKSLVKIDGTMPIGAEIYDKNAIYKVTNLNTMKTGFDIPGAEMHNSVTVSLVKWINGKNAKFTGTVVRNIMGNKYRIDRVKSNAFKTSAGKKLKKMTIKPETEIVFEKKALNGTKNLKHLYVNGEHYTSLSDHTKVFGVLWRDAFGNENYKNFLEGAGNKSGVTVHVSANQKEWDEYKKKWFIWKDQKYLKKYQQKSLKEVFIRYGLKDSVKIKFDKSYFASKKNKDEYYL